LTGFERFICERENLVFDSLIYLEPVERFKKRSSVVKFRSFGDSTSSRVKDKLKMIKKVTDLDQPSKRKQNKPYHKCINIFMFARTIPTLEMCILLLL